MKAVKKTNITKRGKVVEISEDKIFELASRFWNRTEIAAFYECSDQTISNKYNDIFIKGRESGKGSLRDWQLASARKGNVTMQIWLGKQYLDQSDKMQNTNLTETELERLRQIAVSEMKENL
jgi:hypothetical protein